MAGGAWLRSFVGRAPILTIMIFIFKIGTKPITAADQVPWKGARGTRPASAVALACLATRGGRMAGLQLRLRRLRLALAGRWECAASGWARAPTVRSSRRPRSGRGRWCRRRRRWADGDRDIMCAVYKPGGELTDSALPLAR
jgi:hypothetical protein